MARTSYVMYRVAEQIIRLSTAQIMKSARSLSMQIETIGASPLFACGTIGLKVPYQ